MTEDRDQDRSEEREGAARPVTAAARRERRASARASAGTGRVEDRVPAGKTADARPRRARQDGSEVAEKPLSKKEQGLATPKRGTKEKRPSVFARLARFIREVIGELRKVIWPTRKQQITYTIVVLVFVAFVVALVSGLDILFAKGVFWVFA